MLEDRQSSVLVQDPGLPLVGAEAHSTQDDLRDLQARFAQATEVSNGSSLAKKQGTDLTYCIFCSAMVVDVYLLGVSNSKVRFVVGERAEGGFYALSERGQLSSWSSLKFSCLKPSCCGDIPLSP